jgi:hypothetical protein
MNSASHHQTVQNRLRVRRTFGFALRQIQIQISLTQCHIVRMRKTRIDQLPVEALRHLHHRIVVPGVAGGLRRGEQPVVQRRERPLLIEHRLRSSKLPVRYLLRRLAHIRMSDRRREVSRQRSGIIGRISRRGPLNRRDLCGLRSCGLSRSQPD